MKPRPLTLPDRSRNQRRPHAIAMILLGAAILPGCTTRAVTKEVYLKETPHEVQVFARHESSWGTPIDQGYSHPAQISIERFARILSTIYVRTPEDGLDTQRTAIVSDLIYPIATALHKSFRHLESSQELAVMAIRKDRHFGVFARKYLTSFTTFVQDDSLFILLSRIEWDMDEARSKRNKKVERPMPKPSVQVMEFRTVPNFGLSVAGPQGVRANWRDDYWQRIGSVQRTGTGQVKRRTILMDSDIPDENVSGARGQPQDLPSDPEILRALADLEEARSNGLITESEYQRKRRELLE